MARKKKTQPTVDRAAIGENVEIAGAGVLREAGIVDTLRENYMPYAMSVIVSRALPEIDGFKPAHRKLLYTMYLMGLQSGARTKSANVVGQTMKLNPHGDAAIYETMVRLSRGNEALLHPYVDSKGNFGKAYSRDMAYAASRYTEVKLADISAELFRDIGKDTIDFVDNYDGTMQEPTLFPATFPSILVNANIGIAVGMASSICPFNLAEVCETTVALLRDPDHDIASTLKAPDFPGGGELVYDPEVMRSVYETGRGSIKVRARWTYVKENNCIEVTEIPPSTTVEAIMDKLSELVKTGKVRELSDMRDETDLKGLRLTLDLKRGTDPDKLMQKLFRMTPLEDTFGCNFTVLIAGTPQLLGVRAILEEWTAFRRECIRRRTCHDLQNKQDRLHLLQGLEKILLDIDRAVRIVRETEEEREVIPNLMIGFGIDEVQANYIAEIRLRHLNREYILSRISEREKLEEDIAELEAILKDRRRIDRIIMHELADVAKKYVQPRRTRILYDVPAAEEEEAEKLPDYAVNLFFTAEGYFKKVTPQSLRMSGEHKLKDGDRIAAHVEGRNDWHLLFFTDKGNAYKARPADFEDTRVSVMGDYIPTALRMEEDEHAVTMAATPDYRGHVVFFYENGKAARVPLAAYETKTNRRRLQKAVSVKSGLAAMFVCPADREFAVFTTNGRMLLVNSALIPEKQTKDTQGVAVLTLKKNAAIERVVPLSELELQNPTRYRTRTLPAMGAVLHADDVAEQLTLGGE